MHSYRFTVGNTAILMEPAWRWAIGYGVMAGLFVAARFVTEPGEGH